MSITAKLGPSGRRRLSFAIAICAAIYGLLAFRLEQNVPGFRSDSSLIGNSTPVTSTLDVPDSVQNGVMNTLSNVAQLDEVVVLGDPSHSGYDVSATVDLGDAPVLTSSETAQVKADLDAFFKDLYTNRQDIKQAELFFLQNGQAVAGAGVGSEAYQKLSLESSTMSAEDLTTVLQHTAVDESQDPNEAWIETNLNGIS